MHCPECGQELTIKIDICPNCGADFTELSESRRKIVFNRPLKIDNSSNKKIRIDSSNVNGYFVGDGVSIKSGKKLKKGARTSRSAIVYNWGGGLGSDDDLI